MRKLRTVLLFSLIFALGAAVGLQAKKRAIDPAQYQGLESQQAAGNLLQFAEQLAEKGSWERIAVARMYFLGGQKERGAEIIDGIRKKDSGDWMRIGRMHYQAGDWPAAREIFDRVLKDTPKDEDWLAEVGAYYNLQGDREAAEKMFARSFNLDPDNLYNTLKAAGSYIGVEDR